MTWDEIRAAYPNQRIFVSAIEESFDGELVHYRPIAVLESVPKDEHAAFVRLLDLEILHQSAIVNADTSEPNLVGFPAICVSRLWEYEDETDALALPAMRIVTPQVSRPPRAD